MNKRTDALEMKQSNEAKEGHRSSGKGTQIHKKRGLLKVT